MSIEPFPLSGGMQILAGAKIVKAGGGRARQLFYSCSSLQCICSQNAGKALTCSSGMLAVQARQPHNI